MAWGRTKEFSRTLGWQLSLGYAAIFTGSALLLFVLLYYLLGQAITAKDRDLVLDRLHAYESIYGPGGAGGVIALKARIDMANELQAQESYFVRVVGTDGTPMLIIRPADWVRSDLQLVPSTGPETGEAWTRLPRDASVDLTVAFARMPDGALLQVGRHLDDESHDATAAADRRRGAVDHSHGPARRACAAIADAG
jgi:hypothetical protein